MARMTPAVQSGTLTWYVAAHERQLAVGTPAWYTWLEEASLFAFAGETGTFTARKEPKPHGGTYWQAYRKRGGRLYRAYLGKSEVLTLERLNATAALLARRGEGEGALHLHIASSDGSEHADRQDPSSPDQTARPEHLPHDVDVANIPPSNLPVPLTPLVGREQERAAVCGLLRRPEVRLLTLTGTGGIGKTRLGLAVANDLLADYADGVYFVNLAPIGDPALVIPTIAQALDVKETAGRLLLELLRAFLREKHLLLVLDNFEQVPSAAVQVAELLATCPQLKAVVTSRTVLRVGGEQAFTVPPLAVPDPQCLPDVVALSQYESVALFLQRAQALKPEFQLTRATAPVVAKICARLEGLPLAIELAAARITLLPPQALLSRLGQRLAVLTTGTRDAPARQQTLRQTIEWSYHLLDESEQRLFRQLSVFVGGCTLQSVEAVCGALGDEAGSVLDGVASLIDKNLLQQMEQEEEPRFFMLETIREYGLERLAASKEIEATMHAHAAYYLQLAEEAAQNWFGPEQKAWFDRLEREQDNLRTALHWLPERGAERERVEMALRLGIALWYFWLERFHRSEGRTFLERALATSQGVSVAVRAKALWVAGNLAGWLGDFDRGEMLCQESLALFRQVGDTAGVGRAVFHLGIIGYTRGDFAAARSWFEGSLALHEEVGDKEYMSNALFFLACTCIYQGEYTQGRSLAEASLALCRELGDKEGIAATLRLLARERLYFQGDLAKAAVLYKESLELSREIHDGEGEVLGDLGEVYLSQGNLTMARSLLEESVALLQREDEQTNRAWSLSLLAKLAAVQGDDTTARALYEACLRINKANFMANSPWYLEGLAVASYLEGLAAVVAVQGELTWAAHLWGAAEALRETRGTPLPPVYRADYERSVAASRTHLGEKTFAVAWAQGRTMTPEQALAAQSQAAMPRASLAGPPSVLPARSSALYPDGLTAREVEVLRLVAQGLTDAQVAEKLVISPHTVNSHLKAIYGKIGVSSRSAATHYAIEHHLR
jgi:predicted ATPase/DNA-binding CsgD family transcriptional regulator